jgi:hypothetical protein
MARARHLGFAPCERFGRFHRACAVLMVAATSLFMVLAAPATLIGPDEVFTGPGME